MEMQILTPTHGRLVGGRALDYLDHFDANLDDEKEMIFEVKDRKRAGLGLVGMWAFEAWTRLQNPGMAPGDFDYAVESCIKDDTLYQYHDHQDLEEVAGRMFGELR
jgi:hypothetical protein